MQMSLAKEKIISSKFIKQLQKGILSDVIDLMQDESAKDFILIVDGEEFPVHKFMLEARVPTLAEALKNNPKAKNMAVPDISVDIFKIVMDYLYTDKLPRDDDTDYFQLFIAASLLRLDLLKFFAGVKSCNLIIQENVIEMLTMSDKYGHEQLKSRAFDEIKKFYPNIKFDSKWINDVSKIIEVIKTNGKRRVSRIPVRTSLV
ncbi:speckle-type POZ protein-like [Chironomus tepperi]|uniref:speckle-type POZ protein-like n=1 Tax=Chironomus tepperi TaxID=113505 RepID=UPI00391F79F9